LASPAENFRNLLLAEFRSYAELSTSQLYQLEQHFNLLVKWNKHLNLTRIESVLDSVRFHYCESLYVGLKLPAGPLRVADVGSGAGFPGIPIAILRPDLSVTLIESHKRKAVFLREAIRHLGSTRVLSVRAEEVPERFDWVVSRAVAPSEVLSSGLAPTYALLVAAKDVPAKTAILRSPWGDERVLAFHVERSP
jgi:16S rRNA (guanine(527)-N(7))-methyltransferase RsmG